MSDRKVGEETGRRRQGRQRLGAPAVNRPTGGLAGEPTGTRPIIIVDAGGRYQYGVPLSLDPGFEPGKCFACQERRWDFQCVWCHDLVCRGCGPGHLCLEEAYHKDPVTEAECLSFEEWLLLRTNPTAA